MSPPSQRSVYAINSVYNPDEQGPVDGNQTGHIALNLGSNEPLTAINPLPTPGPAISANWPYVNPDGLGDLVGGDRANHPIADHIHPNPPPLIGYDIPGYIASNQGPAPTGGPQTGEDPGNSRRKNKKYEDRFKQKRIDVMKQFHTAIDTANPPGKKRRKELDFFVIATDMINQREATEAENRLLILQMDQLRAEHAQLKAEHGHLKEEHMQLVAQNLQPEGETLQLNAIGHVQLSTSHDVVSRDFDSDPIRLLLEDLHFYQEMHPQQGLHSHQVLDAFGWPPGNGDQNPNISPHGMAPFPTREA